MTGDSSFRIQRPPAELSQAQEAITLEALEDYPYKSVALGSTRANLTGLWRYWRPYFQTKRAPCDAACPVGNQIVDYIQTALEGHWPEAANLLRAENPLPAITGRVCHRPCEMSCNRRQYDQRIAIHDIEAVLAEIRYEPLQFPAVQQPRKVAVVGSGPAELAFAHFMALLHHRVTLLEADESLGGRLRHGPQARHLGDDLLDAEIARIVNGRVEVDQSGATLTDLEPGGYDAIFGVLEIPGHLSLHVPEPDEQHSHQDDHLLSPLLGGLGDDPEEPTAVKVPLRVSEAIGYGKWAALMMDSDWRGLDPSATLTQIQVGGNTRIVSALKYLALLTDHGVERTEEVVSYEKLRLDMLGSPAPPDAAKAAAAQEYLAGDFASPEDFQRVLAECARCLSCGRCNGCDNCWVYCPDAVISRDQGKYDIDYDYCKGCSVCAAVCPRSVISVIEEEKWQADSARS